MAPGVAPNEGRGAGGGGAGGPVEEGPSDGTAPCRHRPAASDGGCATEVAEESSCRQRLAPPSPAQPQAMRAAPLLRDVVLPPVFVTAGGVCRTKKKKLAFTWSRVSPSFPPSCFSARHAARIDARPRALGTGPLTLDHANAWPLVLDAGLRALDAGPCVDANAAPRALDVGPGVDANAAPRALDAGPRAVDSDAGPLVLDAGPRALDAGPGVETHCWAGALDAGHCRAARAGCRCKAARA